MTAEVDAWFYSEGEPQPENKETPLLQFAREARSKRLPHWFEFGAALLSIDETEQEEIRSQIDRMIERSKTDLLSHSLTVVFKDRPPTQPGCLMVFQSRAFIKFVEDRVGFARYLQAKKTQCGMNRAFGCVLDGQGRITNLIYESAEYSVSDFSDEEWSRLQMLDNR